MASEIKVDTISEKTSTNGVAIDSVLLKDGKIDVQGVDGGIIVDADNDTTISANTDDELLIKTAGNTAFKIDANGHITKPLQSAFIATSASQSNVSGDGTDYQLTWTGTEVADRNADFATPTFTAPVTGLYLLTTQFQIDQLADDHTSIYCWFVTSNANHYINGEQENRTAANNQFLTGSSLVDMDANDTASITLDVRGGSKVVDVGAGWKFTGVLIA